MGPTGLVLAGLECDVANSSQHAFAVAFQADDCRRGVPAVAQEWHYSVRSAAIGLIRVARRAGSQVATRAAAASRAGATVKATGSSAPTS